MTQKTITLGLMLATALSVSAANYHLTKGNDKAVDPFAAANVSTYWSVLETGDPAQTITGEDICYVDGTATLVTSGSKELPCAQLWVGRQGESLLTGTVSIRAGLKCKDIQWVSGDFSDGSPSTTYSISGGTVTLSNPAQATHKMYFSTATPNSTSGFRYGITSKLVAEDPATVIEVLLTSKAKDDCHGSALPYTPCDAQVFFSEDNSAYKGRFAVHHFGHLAFDSALSAGAPETLVADKIELQANSRLAVASGVLLNANCGITVTGEDAKLVAKTYKVGSTGTDYTDFTLPMPITGACGLIKDGDGTVTLAGAYTAGDLVVAAGTLVLEKTASFPDGQKVTVKSGARLLQKVYVPNIDVTCEEGGTYEKDIKYIVPYEGGEGGVTRPLDLSTLPIMGLPDSLSLSEPIAIPCHEGLRLDVAKLPADASAETFRDASEKTYGLPKTSFEIEERGEGVRMLVLVARPTVVSIKDFDNQNEGLTGSSANWSNGEKAKEGFDYLVTNKVGQAGSSFDGDSVTFAGGIIISLRKATTEFGPTVIWPGVTINPLVGVDRFTFGKGTSFTLMPDGEDGTVLFTTAWATSAKMVMHMDINRPISGSGNLRLKSNVAKENDGERWLGLTGDNEDFTGRILTEAKDASWEMPFELRVGQASSLGGPLPVLDRSALTLAECTLLTPTQTMTVATANRGIYVANGGFNTPEGVTLTLAEPLRIKTEAHKRGAGTLALGGAISFGSNGAGTSGSLLVEEGFVAALADDAVAGLNLTFSDGAGIVVSAAATTEDGFSGTVAADENVKIPVRFEAKGLPRQRYVRPICTVPTASMATDLANVFVAGETRGYICKIEKVSVDAETVRYQMAAEPSGLVFIVK